MNITIQPSTISGTIEAPASKSAMQRACAAALLSKGSTHIINPGKSNDDLAALDVIQKLGAVIVEELDGSLMIYSNSVDPVSPALNCGESGLGMRLFAPIAALSNQPITIEGEGSLLNRPMHFFDEIFPQLGIAVESNSGKLPLKINGPLVPATIEVDGSLSSQFITGLLMAYGGAGARNVSIKVKNLASKPYVDLTLSIMKQFGVEVENRNYESFYFPDKQQSFQPQTYTVEGDWSGAAFLLVAGAVAGKILVQGLDTDSMQADKAISQALSSAKGLTAFEFDATHCPDLFPPLVALAAHCLGTSTIKGVGRLAHKESDRAIALQQEFGKMNVKIEIKDDHMFIHGGKMVKGAVVHSHHDHRIAMACAVAALKAKGETTITDAEAINKSYPDFYDHLTQLGAIIIETRD